jgi:hypothetical protein
MECWGNDERMDDGEKEVVGSGSVMGEPFAAEC